MATYKVLSKQIYTEGAYSLVPIRMEDRYAIMQWRNEQLYHLRQNNPLTVSDQDNYFENVVAHLFDQDKPNQILFSYLKNDQCIGYGGLVHINWIDKNAEISFIMDTALEKEYFSFHWQTYLGLIEKVAFDELHLHKIYTYAFDLRPHLYDSIEKVGFKKEAVLKEHCSFNDNFIDVLIHSKISNQKLTIEEASVEDVNILFDWANDLEVRANAFNSKKILWEDHLNWFQSKLKNSNSKIFILRLNGVPVGQIRFDYINKFWEIDYSIDNLFRGKGLGKKIVELGIKKLNSEGFIKAKVKKTNPVSIRVFQKLGFELVSQDSTTIIFQKNIN